MNFKYRKVDFSMKHCPVCNAQLDDNAMFCGNCGAAFTGQASGEQPVQPQSAPAGGSSQNGSFSYPPYQPPKRSPYDHTEEFDHKDISDNKVFAMGCYLLSFLGVIIALLASHKSEYAMFHVRQAMKFIVLDALIGLLTATLFWTFIIPILGGIAMLTLLVIRIISFVQICQGKAVEPYLVRNLGFLH